MENSTSAAAAAAAAASQPADHPQDKLRVRDLYKELGEAGLQAISQEFYDRVYADDEEPWFRDMFAVTAATPKDLAVFSQLSFFVQRFGGDPYYGGLQKDSAFIREVHSHFRVTPRGYERWMHHMKNTLGVVDLGPRGDEVREVLLNYFSAFGKSTINAKKGDEEGELRPRTLSNDLPTDEKKKKTKKEQKPKKEKKEKKTKKSSKADKKVDQ